MGEIERLLAAVEMLRKRVHKEIPSQHIALLLAVAENPGVLMPDLCRQLNMPQGTLSRNVKVLSHYVERRNGLLHPCGRNLLRTQPDPGGTNCLAVYLTGRGETVVTELLEILFPEQQDQTSLGQPDYSYRRQSGLPAYTH